jgi:hypothetical protein
VTAGTRIDRHAGAVQAGDLLDDGEAQPAAVAL